MEKYKDKRRQKPTTQRKIKKKTTNATELCTDIPKEFGMFLTYTMELEFAEKPDYDYIRKLLSNVRDRMSYPTNVRLWDWNEMFLRAREKNCSLVQYSGLKKKYEKLYEGYVVPPFEEYLNGLMESTNDETSHNVEIKIVDSKKFK